VIRVGEVITFVCTQLDEDGVGLGESDGWRIHVAGALPDERVTARIAHTSPHRREDRQDAWADLQAVETVSVKRVSAPCCQKGVCGSCPLAILDYGAQLDWKRDQVRRALAQHPELARLDVEACVASPRITGYRNNAKYIYGRGPDGQLLLGAYAPRSHDVVDMSGCAVIEPALSQVRDALLPILVEQQVAPFDEVKRTGLLRYVIMRATAAGRVLVTLVTARADWPQAHAIAATLVARCPLVCGVIHNVNPSTGNALFGDQESLLAGSPTFEDDLGPIRVRLGSRSFFQANRLVAAHAYGDLVAAARQRAWYRRAVDAYAGAGGIALSVAPLADEVVAIEEVAAATLAAQEFLASLPPANRPAIRFVTGDVAEHLASVGQADLVILNPPRKGCARAVLDAVVRLQPRFVAYLSCNPQTLARDLAVLARAGLKVASITPYDMLPHTPHVESLALVEGGSALLGGGRG
jgi:23S rRNA (uracil1939-C5)-methyltransferase